MMLLSNFIGFFTEDSKQEPDDPSNDNIDVDEVPSACNQSTQTENIVDLDKDPLKEDVANETDV